MLECVVNAEEANAVEALMRAGSSAQQPEKHSPRRWRITPEALDLLEAIYAETSWCVHQTCAQPLDS